MIDSCLNLTVLLYIVLLFFRETFTFYRQVDHVKLSCDTVLVSHCNIKRMMTRSNAKLEKKKSLLFSFLRPSSSLDIQDTVAVDWSINILVQTLKTFFLFFLNVCFPAGVSAARKRDGGQRRVAGSEPKFFPPDWGGARAQRLGGGHDVWCWRWHGVQQLQRLVHVPRFLLAVICNLVTATVVLLLYSWCFYLLVLDLQDV